MKFGQLAEYNKKTIFFWKVILKMWRRNFSQIFFWKNKIQHISGSLV